MDKTWNEFTIASITTGKEFPRRFLTKEAAEEFRQSTAAPEHWKLVYREVLYTDWHPV